MSSKSGIVFAAFSCLFAIIVLILCQFHSIRHYVRNKSKICGTQKRMMQMECAMITLFLLPSISTAFLRNNYFTPYPTSVQDFSPILCRLSMVLVIPLYMSGKIILYALLLYRVYKTFEGTIFQISKKVPYVLIALLIGNLIPLTICNIINVFAPYNHVVVEQIEDVLVCDLQYNANDASITLLLILPIFNILIEIFVCSYLIYLFVSRLTRLRRALIEINVYESTQTDSSSRTYTTTTMNPTSDVMRKIITSYEMAKCEAQKLKQILLKQTILAGAALASSLLFYVYGIALLSSDFMGLDVIVCTLSIHLVFSYCRFIWDTLSCNAHESVSPNASIILH